MKTLYEKLNVDVSSLSLISFVNEYKKGISSETEENEKEIIMKTKIENSKNKYQMYQELYISKDTQMPTHMKILDINKNVTVYILYNEIKINQTSKGDIL